MQTWTVANNFLLQKQRCRKKSGARTGWNSTVTHRVHVCVITLASGSAESITLLKLPEAFDCISMTELGALT